MNRALWRRTFPTDGGEQTRTRARSSSKGDDDSRFPRAAWIPSTMVYSNPDASVSYCFPSVRRSFSSSSSVFLPRLRRSFFGYESTLFLVLFSSINHRSAPTIEFTIPTSLSLSFFLSIPRTTRNNNSVSRKEFQSFIKPRLLAMVLLHFLGSTYACACSLRSCCFSSTMCLG